MIASFLLPLKKRAAGHRCSLLRLSVLALFLISPLLSFGQELDKSFLEAQAAYDDGRYAEAVMLYSKLLDRGVSNHEVHYNLANAYFKDSDLSHAVWHYRKAWHDAPRDPDIRANLHFALNAAGALVENEHHLPALILAQGDALAGRIGQAPGRGRRT